MSGLWLSQMARGLISGHSALAIKRPLSQRMLQWWQVIGRTVHGLTVFPR